MTLLRTRSIRQARARSWRRLSRYGLDRRRYGPSRTTTVGSCTTHDEYGIKSIRRGRDVAAVAAYRYDRNEIIHRDQIMTREVRDEITKLAGRNTSHGRAVTSTHKRDSTSRQLSRHFRRLSNAPNDVYDKILGRGRSTVGDNS